MAYPRRGGGGGPRARAQRRPPRALHRLARPGHLLGGGRPLRRDAEPGAVALRGRGRRPARGPRGGPRDVSFFDLGRDLAGVSLDLGMRSRVLVAHAGTLDDLMERITPRARPGNLRLRGPTEASDSSEPGIRRRRRGRGFEYRDDEGRRIDDPEVLERIRELAIPPAWTDVWICPPTPWATSRPWGPTPAAAGGTGTATGGGAARPAEVRRDDRLRPRAAGHAPEGGGLDLQRDGMGRGRASRLRPAAARHRLLPCGREDYAVENETYGLATILKEHVAGGADSVTFDYPAKGGRRQVQAIVVEPEVRDVVSRLRRRRGGGDDFLAYKRGRRWLDVRSDEVNAYLHRGPRAATSRPRTSAPGTPPCRRPWRWPCRAPWRTPGWAASAPSSGRSMRVAYYLGNTPAVARALLHRPADLFDAYASGLTIGGALEDVGDVGPGRPAHPRGGGRARPHRGRRGLRGGGARGGDRGAGGLGPGEAGGLEPGAEARGVGRAVREPVNGRAAGQPHADLPEGPEHVGPVPRSCSSTTARWPPGRRTRPLPMPGSPPRASAGAGVARAPDRSTKFAPESESWAK